MQNESKHSEMGPVRQNPIQRTVSLFICVCIALCTIVAHNIAQNRPDSFPPYPPDDHHCSDDVYFEGRAVSSFRTAHMYHVCAYHCVQLLHTTQHRTVLIIFPCILETIIIAQMTSTGGEGSFKWHQIHCNRWRGDSWNVAEVRSSELTRSRLRSSCSLCDISDWAWTTFRIPPIINITRSG